MNIYVSREGAQSGPFTEAQLHSMLSARLISPDDLAWREGQPEWQTVRAVLGLAEPPPPPKQPPAPPLVAQPDAGDELRVKMQKKTTLSGVGGWLTLFCVGLTILGPLWFIGLSTYAYEKAEPALDRFPDLKSTVDFETGGCTILVIYGLIVGVFIWSGSPSGRRIAQQFLIISLVGFLAIEAITYSMLSDVSSAAGAADMRFSVNILREVVYFLTWWFYFKRSVRVRNTYGPDTPLSDLFVGG